MANGRILGSVGSRSDSYSYYIDWQEESIDIGSNTSIVKAWVHVSCSKHSAYQNNCPQNLYINGVHFTNILNISLSAGTIIDLIYGEVQITHEPDGSKRINISADGTLPYGNGWGPSSGSASEDVYLDTIPRYTTVYASERTKTLNSISINWSATDVVDWIQSSLNGIGWVNAGGEVASDNKSGYYTIANLNPDTEYQINTRCRRADSSLWTEAGNLYIRTKDIARITSVQNINFAETVNLKFSNLANGSTKLSVKVGDVEICSRNNLTANYELVFTNEELKILLKQFKNETVQVAYTITTNSIYSNVATATITLQANINKKDGGIWKRSKLYKKDGSWKMTRLFYKSNGIWRNTK